jgi:superfamily II DNA or RNA helicase
VVNGTRAPGLGELVWIGERPTTDPEAVLTTLAGAFRFAEASSDGTSRGLRIAQLGAVHAVLAHWTTDAEVPATVVMPTGTGKTETMLALFACVLPPRLLVVVPSDALRTQIAEKFETLGVLPAQEVVVGQLANPVVGRIAGRFADGDSAKRFATACNVLVTTPSALFASGDTVVAALLGSCSHLFVDEAHHVEARTWRRIRDAFIGKPVLQFTATPYREDGLRLDGRQIYNFKLRQAQRLGYFAPIDYVSVVDFAAPDLAIATQAVDRLRTDLAAGFDHILMARVDRIGRTEEIRNLYVHLAPNLAPVIVTSLLNKRDRQIAVEALDTRRSRIVICVDMLGEGFDLPALKVAAIHNPHKSLGVTLQYVGRFARATGANIGRASVFVGRPEGDYDPRLRRLFAEDADWNSIISDLSAAATQDEVEADRFDAGFSSPPRDVSVHVLAPKMSCVVYRTACDDWDPAGVANLYNEEAFLTWPVPINVDRRVVWFVVEMRSPVPWADLPSLEEVVHHLYIAYWDAEAQLLYINSSNTDSYHEDLARTLAGAPVVRITGTDVYRVMHNIQRLVPTNVGLLDVRNYNRRFSMLVGADVSDGFPTAEAQTKSQTNIFASGFEDGARVTIGASTKGRVWSYRVAKSIKHWVDWCDKVGAKLGDAGISIDQVMGAFIRPEVLQDRPDLAPLAIEWPWGMWLWTSEETALTFQGNSCKLFDAELRVTSNATTGPITFDVCAPNWTAAYSATVENERLVYRAATEDVVLVRARTEACTLSDYFTTNGPQILFEKDAIVVPPALLLKPARDLPPYDMANAIELDWTGVDRSTESQGPRRNPTSIQAYALRYVMDLANWDVVLDDDGTGEVADIVALHRDGEWLRVLLVHCKWTSVGPAGARLSDLYEVCGQAQKSIRWRHYVPDMFDRLIRRERDRLKRSGVSGFMAGDGADLYALQDAAGLLRPDFSIAIAQPGLSKARANLGQLHLLGSTEVYIHEVAAAKFIVVCDA